MASIARAGVVDLQAVSDYELEKEVIRRGYRLSRFPFIIEKELYHVVDITRMSGADFHDYLWRVWKIKLPCGRTTLGLLDALTMRFPHVVGYDAIIDRMYGHDPQGGPLNTRGVIATVLCKMRPKLEGSPFSIETYHSSGLILKVDRDKLLHPPQLGSRSD